MKKAFLWAALVVPLVGQAAVIGTMFGQPYIAGTLRVGEFEQVQRDFAKGFSAKGLDLKVDADSSAFETMRIGLWLAERRPALRVRRQCVDACATFLLMSGSSARIEKGTLIAFSTETEQLALIFDYLKTNPDALFVEGNEISQLSRARLLQRFKTPAEVSALIREATDRLVPAGPLKFLRELTHPSQLKDVAFDEENATFKVSLASGRCRWWIPDAVGLSQLGIDAPGYEPVDRAAAAKLLKVEPRLIYIGPAVETFPENGLCAPAP